MPITPRFDIYQTDDHVQIDIHVPHVRVSPESLQVVLTDENTCLHFASPPYLLILNFQHAFEENAEDACAQYDPLREHGRITLRLAKKVAGIYWEDLDMVGALMKPRASLNNFIQDVSGDYKKSTWIKEVLEETAMENRFDAEEEPPAPESKSIPTDGYGFARMFQGIFTDLARDGLAREMLEIPIDAMGKRGISDNPLTMLKLDELKDISEVTPQEKRRAMEASKFSTERYLQDTDIQDDYLYQAAMGMVPHWKQTSVSVDSAGVSSINIASLNLNQEQKHSPGQKANAYFTIEESAQLASIPYPLLPTLGDDERQLWLGILDLLFAYCYDHLLTDGDPTVESAWTVFILSCSLSWLESFDGGNVTAEDVVVQSIRRSLIYPYLRNLDFAVFIWKQISTYILTGGRRCVVRCLLQMRNVLDKSELYYLGNKLYIDPYLAWLQDARRHNDDESYLKNLAQQIDAVITDTKTLKEKIDLGLPKIEMEAFQEVEGIEGSSTGSDSDSESSEDSSDSDDSSDEEVDENGGKCEGDVVELKAVTKIETGQEVKHSQELLDGNFGKPSILQENQPSSLILEMSKLDVDASAGDKAGCPPPRPSKLIQEIE
jgi:protein SHQ1